MTLDTSSFGRAIASARKQLKMSQKDLAGKIRKEDGEAITPQYLNDIEHDRRSPSSDHMVKEFARVLGAGTEITEELLYLLAGRVPADVKRRNITAAQASAAFTAFRKELKKP
jgi:transcriptional regulator with XRE-family HTH domain